MRIIAGSFGGRKLRSFPRGGGPGERPTSDRTKTVLFDLLGPLDSCPSAADLFCGTGALGIEALSRGVPRVAFVDRAETACSIVAENVETLGLRLRVDIVMEDAYRFLRREETSWPLLLADPPYGTGHPGRLLALAGERRSLAPGGRLVLEHEVREDPGEAAGALKRVKHRVAGGTALSIYVWGDR